jgi:hypothetical protein
MRAKLVAGVAGARSVVSLDPSGEIDLIRQRGPREMNGDVLLWTGLLALPVVEDVGWLLGD